MRKPRCGDGRSGRCLVWVALANSPKTWISMDYAIAKASFNFAFRYRTGMPVFLFYPVIFGHVEQIKIAMGLGQFRSHTDRPDLFRPQRSLLTNEAPPVQGGAKRANGRKVWRLHDGSGPPFPHIDIPTLSLLHVAGCCTASDAHHTRNTCLFTVSNQRSECH